ncbi:MAG: response regulator [Comamonadaceae bacterium CG_4_9_14_0_8_um_filter_60_18]|nr:MAG: response regulator [Comamonadaceae bacterium CG_4_9_14_0_8_um_filter_60_18]
MVYKLLIVDDSKVSRMMIRNKVSQLQPDWDVLEAGTGDEAVALVRAHGPDFITMDVNMPGISGFDTVAQIRAFDQHSRIAMLTANIQESSRARASDLNVTFVQKPATEPAIRQALDYFLAQS